MYHSSSEDFAAVFAVSVQRPCLTSFSKKIPPSK